MHTTNAQRTDSARKLDRVAASAGLGGAALLAALVTLFPTVPPPDESTAEIVRSVHADADGLLAGTYAGAWLTMSFLVFAAGVVARMRVAESTPGWSLVAMLGAAAISVGLASSAAVATLVRAIEHGAEGDALWLGYGLDHWLGLLVAVPFAIFLIGAAASAALPAWLARLGLVAAGALAIGGASITGDELDGGPLGLVLLVGYAGLFVWIVWASIWLWRAPGAAGRED